MTTAGTTVRATDVNDPRNIGVNLMGTGSISRGYGQPTFGSTVSLGQTISASAYTNIRHDLLNASAHQNGTAAALNLASEVTGNPIIPNNASAFAAYASTVDTNRFNVANARLAQIGFAGNRTASWTSACTATVTMTFASADQARFFWNAGGRVFFSSSRTGGAATAQNTSWSNLLSAVGTINYSGVQIYNLVSSNVLIFTTTAGSPYASNTFTIRARSNFNNSGGAAFQFFFQLDWTDPYVDPSPGNPPAPDDLVDGTLAYGFSVGYPVGGAALSPGGTWQGFNNNPYPFPTIVAPNITGG